MGSILSGVGVSSWHDAYADIERNVVEIKDPLITHSTINSQSLDFGASSRYTSDDSVTAQYDTMTQLPSLLSRGLVRKQAGETTQGSAMCSTGVRHGALTSTFSWH